MTTHTIPSGNWLTHLADAIERADDGDTIQVLSEAAAELAREAAKRMRPTLRVEIVVVPPPR